MRRRFPVQAWGARVPGVAAHQKFPGRDGDHLT
jgi:hypothetical protein